MPCIAPLRGYYGKERSAKGKRGIVFKIDNAHSPVPILIPCGQCVECRLEDSRQWAIRAMHEKQLHSRSCFITLTYDDDCLPAHGSLRKRDWQLFMKRLIKGKGYAGIRHFGCGEYGETTFRPHFHAILFNCDFPDMRPYKKNGRGDQLYVSEELSGYWPLGMCTVGEVTFESAAYCARYVVKKITGPLAEDYYQRVDEYGELVQLTPEFRLVSRRPGLGRPWFDKYGLHSYKHDSVIMRGMPMQPPRYYDGLYELVDSKALDVLKVKRRRRAAKQLSERSPDRRRVREVVTLAKLAMKRREL